MTSHVEGLHFGRGPRGLKSGTSMPATCINSRIPASRGLWPLLAARLNRYTNLRRIHASARTTRPKSATKKQLCHIKYMGSYIPMVGLNTPVNLKPHIFLYLQTGLHGVLYWPTWTRFPPNAYTRAITYNVPLIGLVPRHGWEVSSPGAGNDVEKLPQLRPASR